MSVGFARYAPGESNDWVVSYDEVLIVTKGAFTVEADGRRTTAQAGELIVLSKGTKLTYSAEDIGAELIYVTYPHWVSAQQNSEHAALMDSFQPVSGIPSVEPQVDGVALMQQIWGPLERGESNDLQPFYDALAADVVLTLPVGEARGKDAVIRYFADVAAEMEFNPFEKPLEYYGHGDRVVIVGDETFKIKATGLTHRAAWAWVVHLRRDGLISRILHIQDLSGVTDLVREAVSKTQPAAT
jgi:ethanolamine utilization protein EutQ